MFLKGEMRRLNAILNGKLETEFARYWNKQKKVLNKSLDEIERLYPAKLNKIVLGYLVLFK